MAVKSFSCSCYKINSDRKKNVKTYDDLFKYACR